MSDKSVFTVNIGKRVTTKELIADGAFPAFSANVFSPFGNLNKLLFDDFSLPSVIWGIDGDWMVNLLPKNFKFYPTDHCGYIRIKTDAIHPRYLMWILQKEGERLAFSRSHRASIDRIENISFRIADKKHQLPVINKVLELEQKILSNQKVITKLSGKYAEIAKKYL